MNVLFITHPESDYGASYLYSGFCQLAGAKNVYDFPLKLSYHGQVHKYSIPGIPNGVTAPCSWQTMYPIAWSDEDVEKINNNDLSCVQDKIVSGFFNFIVVESSRFIALETFTKLKGVIRSSGVPVVLHDGEDFSQIPVENIEFTEAKLFLKREIIKGSGVHRVGKFNTRVMPCTFSAPPSVVSMTRFTDTAEYDVSCMMGKTHIFRQTVVEQLRNSLPEPEYNMYVALNPDYIRTEGGDNPNLLPWHDYVQRMCKSKMAVSARGFGWDTCRYWEVPFCTVMVCDTLNIEIINPPSHGVHCLQYSNATDLIDIIKAYKNRDDELRQIYACGREHFYAFHTNFARAKYVVQLLEEELGRNV